MAADGAQEARAHATGAETWGTAVDGAREVRVHVMGAEMQGTAADGAQEARAHAMGAETQGTATDGARDRAKTRGAQRGGVWARVRGVNVGETRAMAMCTPRGPGCVWCVHEGHGQGRCRTQRQRPVVRLAMAYRGSGGGTERAVAAACRGQRQRVEGGGGVVARDGTVHTTGWGMGCMPHTPNLSLPSSSLTLCCPGRLP